MTDLGGGVLGTRHPLLQHLTMGQISSPVFTTESGSALAFGVAGASAGCRVELLADGARVASWSGSDTLRFSVVIVDLRPYAGKQLMVRIVDESRNRNGFIFADRFLLMS
jgi:hypothetical protein